LLLLPRTKTPLAHNLNKNKFLQSIADEVSSSSDGQSNENYNHPNRPIPRPTLRNSVSPSLPKKQKASRENKVVQGHGVAVRDQIRQTITYGARGEKMVALINNEAITEKEFGKGDDGGKTSKTLTN